MITKIEVPNVDDHSVSTDDYNVLADEFQDIANTMVRLAIYTRNKRKAMVYRLQGEIARALVVEDELQRTYEDLPSWAKW